VPTGNDAIAWATLAVLATIAQVFMVEAPKRYSYHATPAFLVAAALLLEPAQIAALIAVALGAEWMRQRYPRYIQLFNYATYVLNTFAAWAVFQAFGGELALSGHAVAGAVLAGLVFTALNHLMVSLVLLFARGVPLKASGVLNRESIETDLALIAIGLAIVVFWQIEPWLIALQVVPMFLFYRALRVPQLEDHAHNDAKTGLLVARRFLELMRDEFERTAKNGHPVSVIMGDLDFFRTVNNTYGHLAGDQVLAAVARIMQTTLRGTDIIGRFGGEEFAMVLRNTAAEGAAVAAERVRSAIEKTAVEVSDGVVPIAVTMSFGVASFPDPCPDPETLLHLADIALYRSKVNGRNRCTTASPEMAEQPLPTAAA
jgi:diguanylate cyclase (GGDEF)-like protein